MYAKYQSHWLMDFENILHWKTWIFCLTLAIKWLCPGRGITQSYCLMMLYSPILLEEVMGIKVCAKYQSHSLKDFENIWHWKTWTFCSTLAIKWLCSTRGIIQSYCLIVLSSPVILEGVIGIKVCAKYQSHRFKDFENIWHWKTNILFNVICNADAVVSTIALLILRIVELKMAFDRQVWPWPFRYWPWACARHIVSWWWTFVLFF